MDVNHAAGVREPVADFCVVADVQLRSAATGRLAVVAVQEIMARSQDGETTLYCRVTCSSVATQHYASIS